MREGDSTNEPFESIDLMSSVLESHPEPFRSYRPASKRLSLNVPASDSASDDDDDYSDYDSHHDLDAFKSRYDDFDPDELILSQTPPLSVVGDPRIKAFDSNELSSPMEHAVPLIRRRFELTPIALSEASESTADLTGSSPSLLHSSVFDNNNLRNAIHTDTHSKSPLYYITHKNSALHEELVSNIAHHKKMLENGDPDLDKIRSMIGQDFLLLSENYISQHELYSKQHAETLKTLSSFRKWEAKSTKLLEEIARIKSPTHEHGTKLTQLLHHDEALNSEIARLESRIEALKDKRRVIKTEIDTTTSVLESKTSKYVTKFKSLELEGRQAAEQVLRAQGVLQRELDSMITTRPVNVSFSKAYLTHKGGSRPDSGTNEQYLYPTNNVPPVPSQNHPAHLNQVKKGLASGSVDPSPISYPKPHDELDQPTGAAPFKESHEFDREKYDHGHGPSPFERGFEYGSKLSMRAKQKMTEIANIVRGSMNIHAGGRNVTTSTNTNTVIEEDAHNNISFRLDIAPIVALLRQKADAYDKMAHETANESAQCHESAKMWQDLHSYLFKQENRMETYVASMLLPPTAENVTWIMNNLHETAKRLQSFTDIPTVFATSESGETFSLLKMAVANESDAISAASKVAVAHFGAKPDKSMGM